VTKVLEGLRASKTLGASLEASLTLYVDPDRLNVLQPMHSELQFLFITSSLTLKPLAEAPTEAIDCSVEGFKVVAAKAVGEKCVRCWHISSTLGQHPDHPQLCPRCVSNVVGSGEKRVYL